LNKIRREFSHKYQWYCIADLDEFHCFLGKTIPEAIREAKRYKCLAIGGVFVDRLAANGTFPPISGPLDNLFPLASDLTYCCGSTNSKISLAMSCVEIELGHHDAKVKTAWGISETHHFKWHKGVHKAIAKREKLYTTLTINIYRNWVWRFIY